MMKRLFKKVPSWHSFKTLGNSKVIRSSYFWLFFVPATAKALESIKDTLTFTVFDEAISIKMSLPFSWQMFYLSSVFFSIGSLVYSIYCPIGIRKYDSFNGWKETGKDESSLITAFLHLYRHKSSMWPFSVTDGQKNYFIKHLTAYEGDCSKITKEDTKTPIALIKSGIPEENIKAAFHFVQDNYASCRPIHRSLCYLSYILGFVFFSVVLIENFFYVVRNGLL